MSITKILGTLDNPTLDKIGLLIGAPGVVDRKKFSKILLIAKAMSKTLKSAIKMVSKGCTTATTGNRLAGNNVFLNKLSKQSNKVKSHVINANNSVYKGKNKNHMYAIMSLAQTKNLYSRIVKGNVIVNKGASNLNILSNNNGIQRVKSRRFGTIDFQLRKAPLNQRMVTVMQTLNNLVLKNHTPGIVLYLKHMECSNNTNQYMVVATEHTDFDLSQWVSTENPGLQEWKSVLYQVLFTLACIKKHHPKFRHNAINAGAIRIQRVMPDGCFVFKHGNNTRYVENTGYIAKLDNFGSATMGVLGNRNNNRVNTTNNNNNNNNKNKNNNVDVDIKDLKAVIKGMSNIPGPVSEWAAGGRTGIDNALFRSFKHRGNKKLLYPVFKC